MINNFLKFNNVGNKKKNLILPFGKSIFHNFKIIKYFGHSNDF